MLGRVLRACALLVALSPAAATPTYEAVYTFGSTFSAQGSSPQGEIYIDSQLNIYGTTFAGGPAATGVIYRVAVDGAETVLVTWTGNAGAFPGRLSRGGMLRGADGNFYGTTEQGGTSDRGVVFRLADDGTYTVLGQFTGTTTGTARGTLPRGMLYRDAAGTLWGTTVGGGSAASGTIWKLPSGGAVETLYDFVQGGATGGGLPPDGLVPDGAGNLYGVTGAGNRFFRLAGGTAYSVGGTLPAAPAGGLLRLADGNFYGTVFSAIYKATPAGLVTTVVDFSAAGTNSRAGLGVDALGNFYFVTNQGGAADAGTILRCTPAGAVTTLAAFTGNSGVVPGRYPSSRPVFGADGNLYGTAQEGASTNGGVVWRMRFGPKSTTLAATGVQAATAQLNGTVNPNGVATSVVFEWGTGPAALTNTTNVRTIGTGTTALSVNATLLGLTGSRTYYYRVRGDNAEQFQPQRGQVFSFTTPADTSTQPPTLTAPVSGTITASPVAVAFTLPEAALAGSVRLVFSGGVMRTLWLAASQEMSGVHSFTFNPADPTGGAVASIVGGTTIPSDSYTVSLIYQDALGHLPTSDNRTNVKIDTVPPVMSMPGPINAEATSAAGAVVTYTASATDGVSGVATSSFSPASGSTFPRGLTIVNASATDFAGNTSTGSFTVTVQDTTPPLVTPPGNLSVHATSPTGVIVSYPAVTTTDAVGVTSLNYSQNSGTLFPNGTTTVTVTAKDAANNTGTATFTVTVTPLTDVESWRYANFGMAENTGNAADGADWDFDGVLNLMEFGFGTDPTNAASGPPALQYAGTFAGSGTVAGPGQARYACEGTDPRALFVRRSDYAAEGLTYTVEFSASLANWTSSAAAPTVLADNGAVQIVSVPYPPLVDGEPSRFFRLRVTLAP